MKKKTGFDYIDNLTDEERADYFQTHRTIWNYMPTEKRAEIMTTYYELIRKKRKENPLLMHSGVSDTEIMREILNVDMPQQLEKTIDESVKNGYFESSEYLRDFKKKFKL
jgi:L-rhamnose mutarotase